MFKEAEWIPGTVQRTVRIFNFTWIVLAAAIFVSTPPTASAQTSAVSFVEGGTHRQQHTATPLLDGRILVVGGTRGPYDPNSSSSAHRPVAEIFDPASGRWTDAKWPFAVAGGDRSIYWHTATLLADGNVFIAGGSRSGPSSTEKIQQCVLYEPQTTSQGTGAWHVVEECLNEPRRLHTATRLLDGRILLTGGNNPSAGLHSLADDLTGAELCSFGEPTAQPRISCRRTENPLAAQRAQHTATRLSDGRVWIAGIRGTGEGPIEVFDPEDGRFHGTSGATPRHNHSTVALRSNGSGQEFVVSFGGSVGADTYDVWTIDGDWVSSGTLHCPYGNPAAATLMPDNSVVLFGGDLDPTSSSDLTCVEQCSLDESSMDGQLTCKRLEAMHTNRGLFSASLLPGRRVLLVGNRQTSAPASDSGSIYALVPAATLEARDMAEPRVGHTSTLLADGRLLVAGGSDSQIFNPASTAGEWSEPMELPDHHPTNPGINDRTYHRATLLQDGRVLLTGGLGGNGNPVASTALYTPGSQGSGGSASWSSGPSMQCPRVRHTATRLWDGRVVVVGGESCPDKLEIFDPSSNQWEGVLDISSVGTFEGHSGTLLNDGRILLAGGEDNPQRVVFLDPLSPPADRISVAPSTLLHDHIDHPAVLLADGRLLLLSPSPSNLHSGEILSLDAEDSADFSSRPVQELDGAPSQRAVLLPDGRVLNLGVFDSTSNTTSDYVLDPTTWDVPVGSLTETTPQGKWAAITVTSGMRGELAASLLANQQLMISGTEVDGSTSTHSALLDLGLDFDEGDRPVLETLRLVDPEGSCSPQQLNTCATTDEPLRLGQPWLIRGRGLVGATEGSGGQGFQHSANDLPILQLRSLNNQQVRTVPVAAVHSELDGTDIILTGDVVRFPPGPSMLTATVNGIPSLAAMVDITYAVELEVTPRNSKPVAQPLPTDSMVEHRLRISNSGQLDATDLTTCLDLESSPSPNSPDGLLITVEAVLNGSMEALTITDGQNCAGQMAAGRRSAVWSADTFPVGSAAALVVTYDLCPPSTMPPSVACVEGLEKLQTRLAGISARQPILPEVAGIFIETLVSDTNSKADLAISISDSKDTVEPGDEVLVTLRVENRGPDAAIDAGVAASAKFADLMTGAEIDFPLLVGRTADECTCQPPCSLDEQNDQFTLPNITLPPGFACTWRQTYSAANIQPSTDIQYAARVDDSGVPDSWTDPVTDNNLARDLTRVETLTDYPEVSFEPGNRPAVAARDEDFWLVFEEPDDSAAPRIRGVFLSPNGEPIFGSPVDLVTGFRPDVTYEHDCGKYVMVYQEEDGEGDSRLKAFKAPNPPGIPGPDAAEDIPETPDETSYATGRNPAVASAPARVGPSCGLNTGTTWIVYDRVRANGGREIGLTRNLGYPVEPVIADRMSDTQFTDVEARVAVKDNDLIALVFNREEAGVYYEIFDPSSGGVRPVPALVDTKTDSGSQPDIAYDPATDRFYIVWKDTNTIQLRSLDLDSGGLPVLGKIIPISPSSGGQSATQDRPRIDCEEGRCSVVWQQSSDKTAILARIVDTMEVTAFDEQTCDDPSCEQPPDAIFQGPEFQVNIDEEVDDAPLPAVVFAPEELDAVDRFLVAWIGSDSEDPEVRSRVIPLHSLLLKAPDDRLFEVTIVWTPSTSTEDASRAQRVPVQPLDNFGYFWFYDPENIEVLVKLLEIGNENWLFYASLTDTPFKVVVQDCGTGDDCNLSEPLVIESDPEPQCGGLLVIDDSSTPRGDKVIACPASTTTRRLFDRFEARVCWQDPNALGVPIPALPLGGVLDSSQTADSSTDAPGAEVASAIFSFNLTPQVNPEVVLKMVEDAGRYFVYYGGATDLAYTLEIIDTDACGGSVRDCPTVLSFDHPAGDFCGGNRLDFDPVSP